jgi:hypothetical protein
MSQADLAEALDDMAQRVKAGDSFEGSIEYTMPDPDDPTQAGTYAMVRASYRVGNLQGQGGVRMIGEMEADAEPYVYGWFKAKPVWHAKGYVIRQREGASNSRDAAEIYFVADSVGEAAIRAPELIKRGWGSDPDKLRVTIISLELQEQEVVIPRW